MSVGRCTSMLSTASTRILAITLIAGFLPSVKADCWQDWDGSRTCDGLGTLTYIMIGLAAVVVSLAIFSILYAHRRRRINRANLGHIQQTHWESRAAYGGPYGSAGRPTVLAAAPDSGA